MIKKFQNLVHDMNATDVNAISSFNWTVQPL